MFSSGTQPKRERKLVNRGGAGARNFSSNANNSSLSGPPIKIQTEDFEFKSYPMVHALVAQATAIRNQYIIQHFINNKKLKANRLKGKGIITVTNQLCHC